MSPTALAPGAVEVAHKENMYEWDRTTGRFQLINILPGGAPGPEEGLHLGAGGEEDQTEHAISSDGSSVIWTSDLRLYEREHIGTAQAETVQADAALGGEGEYKTASSDGSKIFFTKGNLSTRDLYEFDVDTGLTTDMAPNVLGVLGASEDGSYVYYVNTGYNLELWHNGATKLIATLSPNDEHFGVNKVGVAFDWTPEVGIRTARVTPDGKHVIFMSERSITGYDNTVSHGTSCVDDSIGNPQPAQCQEVFLYDAETEHLSCVSCNPDGSPTGPSGIPGGTESSVHLTTYQSRALSEDGSRVFFDTLDGIAPQDTNGSEDVYEWERDGAGGCAVAAGCVSLISGGVSQEGSAFVDASTNGSDLFFITREQLVGQDIDQNVDVYDAREGGGVASPSALACSGSGCQGVPLAPPTFATPPSVTYAGVGNFAPPTAPEKTVTPTHKPKPKHKKKKKTKHKKKTVRKAGATTRRPS